MAERPLRDPGEPDGSPIDRNTPSYRTDRSPWNWLLLVPILLVIWPPLYNRPDPELLGIPFFYWYQLFVIPVGVTCTALVYLRTRGLSSGTRGTRDGDTGADATGGAR